MKIHSWIIFGGFLVLLFLFLDRSRIHPYKISQKKHACSKSNDHSIQIDKQNNEVYTFRKYEDYPFSKKNCKGVHYVSIVEHNNEYYMLINIHNQGNIIIKSKTAVRFSNLIQDLSVLNSFILNESSNTVVLDKSGCMAATMMLYVEGDQLYYVGGSASCEKSSFCDGHYGAVLNTRLLHAVKKDLKMVLKGCDFDTLPSLFKHDGKYYKYTRKNDRKRHLRWQVLYTSSSLFDPKPQVEQRVIFPFNVYSVNIFVIDNIFHGFFWAYDSWTSYENMFISYSTSKDGLDFSNIHVKDIFEQHSVMPANGHIIDKKTNNVLVYFVDFKTSPSKIFYKHLSSFT